MQFDEYEGLKLQYLVQFIYLLQRITIFESKLNSNTFKTIWAYLKHGLLHLSTTIGG